MENMRLLKDFECGGEDKLRNIVFGKEFVKEIKLKTIIMFFLIHLQSKLNKLKEASLRR